MYHTRYKHGIVCQLYLNKKEKKHRKADPNAEGITADNCIIQEESDIHGTSGILHRPR